MFTFCIGLHDMQFMCQYLFSFLFKPILINSFIKDQFEVDQTLKISFDTHVEDFETSNIQYTDEVLSLLLGV